MATLNELIQSNANFLDRDTLEPHFNRGEIPEQEHFYSLIHNPISRSEDGVYTNPSSPLCILASNNDVLHFYGDADSEPTWKVNIENNALRFVLGNNVALEIDGAGDVKIDSDFYGNDRASIFIRNLNGQTPRTYTYPEDHMYGVRAIVGVDDTSKPIVSGVSGEVIGTVNVLTSDQGYLYGLSGYAEGGGDTSRLIGAYGYAKGTGKASTCGIKGEAEGKNPYGGYFVSKGYEATGGYFHAYGQNSVAGRFSASGENSFASKFSGRTEFETITPTNLNWNDFSTITVKSNGNSADARLKGISSIINDSGQSPTYKTGIHSTVAGMRAVAGYFEVGNYFENIAGYFIANNTPENKFPVFPNFNDGVIGLAGYFDGNVKIDGNVQLTGQLNGHNADYGELFEASNKKGIKEGTAVILSKDGLLRPAKKGEVPIGITTKNSAIVGNSYDEWPFKYIKDDFGNLLYEEVEIEKDAELPINAEIIEQNEITIKVKAPQINPEYDSKKQYIPRTMRDEWCMVGLLGQLRMRKGQPVAPSWVKIKDINDDIELWLVK